MTSKAETAKARQERLAAELKANLHKRKAQARARRAGAADGRKDGIGAAQLRGTADGAICDGKINDGKINDGKTDDGKTDD